MLNTVTVQDAIEQLCQRQGGGAPSHCVVVGAEDGADLADTIDELLAMDATTLCLCLLPGEYEIITQCGTYWISVRHCI